MTRTYNPCLAIYPMSKGFGYACLVNPQEIIDYGVATVRPISNQSVLKRLRQLFEVIQPTVVILRDCPVNNSCRSKRIIKLIHQIQAMANENKLSVASYSREEIKEVFVQFGAKTKYEIAQILIEWLPELKVREPSIRKLWMSEDYNMPVFDAFALAVTHFYLTG